MHLKLAAALTATILATPAFAQDEAPPSIGGFRVEGILGYDSTEISSDEDGGVLFGVGLGYDFQVGRRVIVGIDGEASESTNDGCIADFAQPGDALCARAGRDLYVGGRAGVMVGRNFQLYARAGYTNARFTVDYDDGTAGGASNLLFSQNLDGVRVGAGGQLHISRNAFISGEFRYSNYEQGSDRGQFVGGLGFRF